MLTSHARHCDAVGWRPQIRTEGCSINLLSIFVAFPAGKQNGGMFATSHSTFWEISCEEHIPRCSVGQLPFSCTPGSLLCWVCIFHCTASAAAPPTLTRNPLIAYRGRFHCCWKLEALCRNLSRALLSICTSMEPYLAETFSLFGALFLLYCSWHRDNMSYVWRGGDSFPSLWHSFTECCRAIHKTFWNAVEPSPL